MWETFHLLGMNWVIICDNRILLIKILSCSYLNHDCFFINFCGALKCINYCDCDNWTSVFIIMAWDNEVITDQIALLNANCSH